MWKVEDVLRELKEEGIFEENNGKFCDKDGGLPPGFRFHPTDEELITFYLASKVFNTTPTTTNLFLSNSGVQIIEVDLTRCEPWDLPERAKMGEREWYLYSLRDRKYPSGLRTNRATETGYWKATGKDRQVYSTGITTTAGSGGGMLIGMKKTLVFYQGRAPRGVKTKWIMHEYRLDGHFSSFRLSSKEEWVICRIFHKNAEKKYTPQIHHPPSPPPPPPPPLLQPLSPYLGSLPSLAEPANTTTQSLADTTPSQPRHYDLLHSLLVNPLPNFSSISGSNTIFPSPNANIQNTTATSGEIPRFKSFQQRCLSSTTTTTTTTATSIAANTTVTVPAVTKQWQQQQQQWADKIWAQNDYFQNQYHNPLNFDQMMEPQPLPITYTTAATTVNDNDEDNDVNVDVDVDVDVEAAVHHVEISPSFAVAALDRMLNHTINHHHPTESWSFRLHP